MRRLDNWIINAAPGLSMKALCLALLFLLLPAAQVAAADITVGSSCSLANAITSANGDSATGGCAAGSGDDAIILSADIILTATLPTINSNISVTGGGYTISGDNKYQIILQSGGSLTLNNLNLIQGKASNDGGAIYQSGGAIILNSVVVSDSQADYGGGIYSARGPVNHLQERHTQQYS